MSRSGKTGRTCYLATHAQDMLVLLGCCLWLAMCTGIPAGTGVLFTSELMPKAYMNCYFYVSVVFASMLAIA
jgi:hypothetical protein